MKKPLLHRGDRILCYGEYGKVEFHIHDIAGQGIEGDTFVVTDELTGERRSLKVLRGYHTPILVEHAAAVYRRLVPSPYVKSLRDTGILVGQRGVGVRGWMAFDYIEGMSLDRYLHRPVRLPALRLIELLIDTVCAIHEARVTIGDFSGGANFVVEEGIPRLVCVDLDWNAVGSFEERQQDDLIELRKMVRKIARVTGERADELPRLVQQATTFAALRLALRVRRTNNISVALCSQSSPSEPS